MVQVSKHDIVSTTREVVVKRDRSADATSLQGYEHLPGGRWRSPESPKIGCLPE
jgi:hypothetical protein